MRCAAAPDAGPVLTNLGSVADRRAVGCPPNCKYTVIREEMSLRIAVIGGGPGGLYFAYLWKKRHPEAQIDLFEQNPAGATWGFGVVFSEQALEFLRADDPDTVDAIAPRMESWKNITLNLRGESVEIDGVGFSSIGRLDLLKILQARVRAVGVEPRYDTTIRSVDELDGYDLIVAADGLNSLVRRSFETEFGASVSHSTNKFAWYGTSKRFETLSQTFVQTGLGAFNAHHYRYAPDIETFLVECNSATWQRYGFADKTIEQSQAICNRYLPPRWTATGWCRTNRCGAISRGSGTSAGRSGIWC